MVETPAKTGRFTNLPLVRCRDTDCGWERRADPELVPILILAGRAHMTESDGHQVELFAPARPG